LDRTHLPAVPESILRRHRVLETYDSRFRSCARLLQALWRAEQEIPIGTHAAADGTSRKMGSRISDTAGAQGRNFMTPEIARLAWREHAYREPGAMIDEQRLWTNMLSSHPLTYNVLGPLRLDLSLATKVLGAMCPDLIDARVTGVAFEHSPGRRDPLLTDDRTAFDAIITYVSAAGEFGFVALELKYSESAWEQQKDLRDRYAELMPATGLFIDPAAAELRKAPLQQFMREHVLAQASIMRGDYSEGRFIVIAPTLNLPVLKACRRYEAHLVAVDERAVGFGVWTLEALIAVLREHGDAAHADGLYRRYCDWSLVDDEIETSFPVKLTG